MDESLLSHDDLDDIERPTTVSAMEGPGGDRETWMIRTNNSEDLFSEDSCEEAIQFWLMINVLVSTGGCLYALLSHQLAMLTEYCQVLYLSTLLIWFGSRSAYLASWQRQFWFVCAIAVAIIWSVANQFLDAVHGPLGYRFMFGLDSFLYGVGSLACGYCIVHYPLREPPKRKSALASKMSLVNADSSSSSSEHSTVVAVANMKPLVDIDLLIYLIALNVLCLMPIDSYNYSLHMILDVRMNILLFTGLYQPKDRKFLLRIKSFCLVLVCIIVAFVIFSFGVDRYAVMTCGEAVNTVIGLTLIWESYHHLYIRLPKTKNVRQR